MKITSPPKKPHFKALAKSKWSWIMIISLLALFSINYVFTISAAIEKLEFALTPPDLPPYQDLAINFLNAPAEDSPSPFDFYHESQGTSILPYNWFIALERPRTNPWLLVFGSEELFSKNFILQHGFIPDKVSSTNPDGLPIGFAKTESMYFPGLDRKAAAIGFTCSACHTGQIVHNNTRYIIDGGPAMIDLGLLRKSLGAALGQTALSSRFNLLNGRFQRFADRVLGSNNNVVTRKTLKEALSKTLKVLIADRNVIEVTEGFTRLDALNRIGNQIFYSALGRNANYSPINAPVNYPHIWSSSWFSWVQYDGSIMQPLTRNAGEALGVSAFIDTKSGHGEEINVLNDQRFSSSIPVGNLAVIESWIGGKHPLDNAHKFDGILPPSWPEAFPKIDTVLANKGQSLYKDHCQGCHLPAINDPEFWSEKNWQKIKYMRNGEAFESDKAYLELPIIPHEKIGTDLAQGNVLTTRTVNTIGIGLNLDICTWEAEDPSGVGARPKLTFLPFSDSATANFGMALGAFAEMTNQNWFKQNNIPKKWQSHYEGNRPNCLQVGKGYRARPLDGIWATAPFLHNGSIASLYDLLSTEEERPTFVQLGGLDFDPLHVGIAQGETVQNFNQQKRHDFYKITDDYVDGHFILDTREPGNHNTGHVFDGGEDKLDRKSGVIGRKLEEHEKMALIEYLKTL